MSPNPSLRPPRTVRYAGSSVIYCILALTAFAYPAGLRDWLEERDSGGRLWLPLAIARQIETASDAIGVKSVGVRLRAWFGQLIGDDQS